MLQIVRKRQMSPWLGPWRIRAMMLKQAFTGLLVNLSRFYLKSHHSLPTWKQTLSSRKKRYWKKLTLSYEWNEARDFAVTMQTAKAITTTARRTLVFIPLNLQSNTNNIVISLVHDQWPTRGNLKPVGLEHISELYWIVRAIQNIQYLVTFLRKNDLLWWPGRLCLWPF